MSAHIIEDETMEIIVTALFKEWMPRRKSVAAQVFSGFKPKALGTLFFMLNTEAVNHRYRRDDAPDAYTHKDRQASAVAALDAIRELIYQCSEGRVMESTHGENLQKAADLLALEVAELELEKFRATKWN